MAFAQKSVLLFFLLFLLLFIPTSHTAEPPPSLSNETPPSSQDPIESNEPTSGLDALFYCPYSPSVPSGLSQVFAIMAAVASGIMVLSFLLSKLTNDTRAENAVRREIISLIVSVLLFFVVLSMLPPSGLLQTLSEVLTSEDYSDLLSTFHPFPLNQYNELILPESEGRWSTLANIFYSENVILSLPSISAGSTLSLPIAWLYPSVTTSISPGLKFSPYSTLVRGITYNIVNSLSLLRLLQALLCFLVYVSIRFLFPFGIFLRLFPYTRNLGSTFIALSISILLLPIFLHLVGDIFEAYPPTTINSVFFQEKANVLGRVDLALSSLATVLNVLSIIVNAILAPTSVFYDIIASTIIGYWATLVYNVAVITMGIATLAYLLSSYFLLLNIQPTIEAFLLEAQKLSIGIFMETLILTALSVLFVLGLQRALSTMIGGEYFLYGVMSYV